MKKAITAFKHGIQENRAVMILENRFGLIGYAFFYKLMEILTEIAGHYIYCDEVDKWEYFLAKVRMQDEQVKPMLDLLALLGVIDRELWEEDKCIFCEDLVQEFNKTYKRRKNMTEVEKPLLRSFFRQNAEIEKTDAESEVLLDCDAQKSENGNSVEIAEEQAKESEEKNAKTEENSLVNSLLAELKAQNSEKNSQNEGQNLENDAKTPISAQIDTTTTSIYNNNIYNNSSSSSSSSSSANFNFSEILDFWNENVPENLKVQYLTDERKNLIKLRLREFDGSTIQEKIEFAKRLIQKTTESDFLMGKSKNSKGWRASFNWLFKNSTNWRKVNENAYQEYENKNYSENGDNKRGAVTYEHTPISEYYQDFVLR